MSACTPRRRCGLCRSQDLRTILSLPDTPLANEFPEGADVTQETFPLRLVMCHACKHVQIGDIVDGERLFRNYLYETATSHVTVEHFRAYAKEIYDRYGLGEHGKDTFVVEVGSNDGTMLSAFKSLGVPRVMGVDPAVAIAKKATQDGVPTLASFFDVEVAKKILMAEGPADVVVANNVLAHAEDIATMLDGVEVLLGERGLFVFEVSYLMDMFEHDAFDTIYHEHFSYHTLKPIQAALASRGLAVYDVLRPQGQLGRGSLRIYAHRIEHKSHAIVKTYGVSWHTDPVTIARMIEREAPLEGDLPWQLLAKTIKLRAKVMQDLFDRMLISGKSICAYGAPAKMTTLAYALGARMDDIEFVIEDAPLKIGRYTPGSHRPVVSSKMVPSASAYCIVFAWNFIDSIKEKWKHGDVTFADGRPVPVPMFFNPMLF